MSMIWYRTCDWVYTGSCFNDRVVTCKRLLKRIICTSRNLHRKLILLTYLLISELLCHQSSQSINGRIAAWWKSINLIFVGFLYCQWVRAASWQQQQAIIQESPAIADKPARRESLQKLLQFDVPTTLSLTILAYVHAFNCYCVRNPRNPEKFTENSNLWSSRSSKVIDIGVNRKPICDLLLVINSNFSCICYRFRDIRG